MKKIKIISIVLVFLLVISIGINIHQASISNKQTEKIDELTSFSEYLNDYRLNKTWFDTYIAYYGDDDMRHYYMFDRIWMTEKEYVDLFWLDCLKMYNDSTIYVEGHGFNKSNITIEWEYMLRGATPYKINDTWFIPIPEFRFRDLPREAYEHTWCWDGTKRAWIIVEEGR